MAIHDLTFTDWENYTDGDGTAFTLDWTDVAAMTRQFPYPYIEAIRQAVLERTVVSQPHRKISDSYWYTILPLDTPVLGVMWADYVINCAIQFLWRGSLVFPRSRYGQEGGYHAQWVAPSSISTMHNVEQYFYDAVSTDMYMGTLASEMGPYDLPPASIHNKMLADAGVTDIAVVAWWNALESLPNYANSPKGNIYGLHNLFSYGAILLSIKQMLGLFSKLITRTGLQKTVPTGTDTFTYMTGIDYRQVLEVGLTAGTTPAEVFASLIATCNSEPWTAGQFDAPWGTPPNLGDYMSQFMDNNSASHTLAWRLESLDKRYYAAVQRVRENAMIDLRGGASRNIEVGTQTHMMTSNTSYLGRPWFSPSDWAGVTGVPDGYGPVSPQWVYATERANTLTTHGYLSTSLGDYGNVSLDPSVFDSPPTGLPLPQYTGWHNRTRIILIEDFDVTDGFIFR